MLGSMRTILLFFLLASAAHPRTELPRELAACLHEANLANTALDVDRQRTLLLHAERLEGRPADAADVQRRLAVLDWKYDERPEAARSRLKKATGGAEAARAWLALSRMEYELKRFEAAVHDGDVKAAGEEYRQLVKKLDKVASTSTMASRSCPWKA